ncbi:MAG TPA: acyl-CoA desaturase [Chloroflexota bacterium]
MTTSLSEAPDLDGVRRAAPGEQLALYRGGVLVGSAPSDTADYAELRRLVVQAGLLERQPLYYALKFASVGLLLALGIALQVRSAYLPGWVQVLNVVFLAFVFGQIGLLGHHVAHMQVFRSARLADVFGVILGDLLLGIGVGWWRESHNGAHHNHPNHFDLDPNIRFYVLAFTPEQGRQKSPGLQWIIRHQAKLITMFACLETVSLHSQTVDYLQRWWHRRTLECAIEAAALSAHVVLYVGFIVFALGPLGGLLFIVVHRALAGLYLASIFAPNHKGMPILYGEGRPDFLHEQVLTARNIHGSPLTDFWYGGLNYQIEHHLFPSMACNRLSRAAPLVREYCATHGLDYHATSLGGAYREMFQQFQHVSDVLNRT